eukprot:59272-Chlamydomonas_euryale.AAC.7
MPKCATPAETAADAGALPAAIDAVVVYNWRAFHRRVAVSISTVASPETSATSSHIEPLGAAAAQRAARPRSAARRIAGVVAAARTQSPSSAAASRMEHLFGSCGLERRVSDAAMRSDATSIGAASSPQGRLRATCTARRTVAVAMEPRTRTAPACAAAWAARPSMWQRLAANSDERLRRAALLRAPDTACTHAAAAFACLGVPLRDAPVRRWARVPHVPLPASLPLHPASAAAVAPSRVPASMRKKPWRSIHEPSVSPVCSPSATSTLIFHFFTVPLPQWYSHSDGFRGRRDATGNLLHVLHSHCTSRSGSSSTPGTAPHVTRSCDGSPGSSRARATSAACVILAPPDVFVARCSGRAALLEPGARATRGAGCRADRRSRDCATASSGPSTTASRHGQHAAPAVGADVPAVSASAPASAPGPGPKSGSASGPGPKSGSARASKSASTTPVAIGPALAAALAAPLPLPLGVPRPLSCALLCSACSPAAFRSGNGRSTSHPISLHPIISCFTPSP